MKNIRKIDKIDTDYTLIYIVTKQRRNIKKYQRRQKKAPVFSYATKCWCLYYTELR